MIISNMSPLASQFTECLEKLVEEISSREKREYVLKRKSRELKNGGSFYYPLRTGGFYSFLDRIFPAFGSLFRISGIHDAHSGEVDINAKVEDRYQSLVEEHLDKFLKANVHHKYKITM